ncbi:MAG: phage terminase large subunit, partial [Desulfobacteraceae bacterium]
MKYSAKSLVEDKIQSLGVSHLFEVTQTEIRHRHGTGVTIFQGMQDHTAESIKSLEGFDIAWVEEAQSLSKRSLRLLRPTIRSDKSEIWFSWNPDQPHDAVAQFLDSKNGPPPNSICVHVNYDQNPLISETLLEEMRADRKRMPPEDFAHIWLGEYNTKSDAIIFSSHYRIDDFQPSAFWDVPYYGLDFGFASDPTAAVKAWTYRNTLYIEYEAGRTKLELDDTAAYLTEAIPDIASHAIRADNARPEAISYLKRHGLPSIKAADKG